ncbi:MAG TPA: GGDEF domain-containing protein [Lachnospiraceae bacterium]|nr:GGDEF domain-containing protein [Lachnospiraceae bacterium]
MRHLDTSNGDGICKNSRKSYTIGVLIGNATSPHTVDLMKGIYHAAKDMGANVLFFLGIHSSYFYADMFGEDSENDFDYQFNTIYDYAWLGKVDAMIISYGSLCIFLPYNDKELFLSRFEGIPHVLLEDREEVEKPSYIISDNYGGMYACVEHLVSDHNYKKIIYLSGPLDNTDAQERRAAYLDVMKKHHLPVDSEMMEVGDYSGYVKKQINTLLDHNPDAEALVCANDVMANTAYKVCEKRGIVVGKDLAITGYDDWEMAQSMDPPLTTVLQNAYDMGYMSLKNALELCDGFEPQAIMMPGVLKYRASCGCKIVGVTEGILKGRITRSNLYDYAQATTRQIVNKIIISDVNEQIREYVTQMLYPFIEAVVTTCYYEDASLMDKQEMMAQLRSLLYGEYGKYISLDALSNELFSFFDLIITRTHYAAMDSLFLGVLRECQSYIQAYIIQRSKEEMETFKHDVWFMPLIVRDMVNNTEDERALFEGVIVKLKAIKTKKAYIYLMKTPIAYHEDEEWKCPDEMYLAAYHEGEKVEAFAVEERPRVTKENGFMSHVSQSGDCCMFCYNIFSAERQYGILIGEIAPEDMSLLYFASMQIGATLRYVEISHMQRNTQRTLEKTLAEIEDKNKVLNFLSEYDELTGCLNRRGFVERVITMNKLHIGQKAALIFGDLDRLKEINDTFGHVEGDFAITSVGKLFREAYDGESIVGRIGGDEFVMMFVAKEDVAKDVVQKIKDGYRQLNKMVEKPYYIEISMGYTEFVCEPELLLSDVLDAADKILYEAKKLRKDSIRKD